VGVTYPDLFAAIGVGSGLEYKSATSLDEALKQLGTDGLPGPDPQRQGLLASRIMCALQFRVPTIVFHGTADTVVPEIHGREVAISMVVANSLVDRLPFPACDEPSISITGEINGSTCTVLGWNGARGNAPVVLYFQVQDMDHRWSGGAKPNVNGAGKEVSARRCSFALNMSARQIRTQIRKARISRTSRTVFLCVIPRKVQ
jgi:poly(3-hydroxybutyrate) depolymerase